MYKWRRNKSIITNMFIEAMEMIGINKATMFGDENNITEYIINS